MKSTLAKAALLASAALTLVAIAAPASAAGFRPGKYTVTFFSGPSHTDTGSQCLQFKHTGAVVGFANSGTWTSPTFAGWGGNYVTDTGFLRVYGTFNSGAGVTNLYFRLALGSGGFDDWVSSAPPITASNDGEVTITAGCANALTISHSASPTR
jgi:hypothetical protein